MIEELSHGGKVNEDMKKDAGNISVSKELKYH